MVTEKIHFVTLFNLIMDAFFSIYNVAFEIWEFMNTPLVEVPYLLPGVFEIPLLSGFIDWIGALVIGDYSMFELMLGSGVVLFLAYTVVKWVMDIIF